MLLASKSQSVLCEQAAIVFLMCSSVAMQALLDQIAIPCHVNNTRQRPGFCRPKHICYICSPCSQAHEIARRK